MSVNELGIVNCCNQSCSKSRFRSISLAISARAASSSLSARSYHVSDWSASASSGLERSVKQGSVVIRATRDSDAISVQT